MTQDEIIEMARQAELVKTIDCCGVVNKFCSQDQWKGNLSVFAKLVAAKEREACATVCDDLYRVWTLTDEDDIDPPDALDCKRAIRARGEA
jgi:hypothetical protein